MKNKILISVLIVGFLLTSCIFSKGLNFKKKPSIKNQDTITSVLNHKEWDKLLKAHVNNNGLVDYKGFIQDKQILNDYIKYLSNQIPNDTWSYNEQLAYFINVYNANTIKLIIENYPIKSIKDVDATISPFLKNFIKIGDKNFSLADIEKGFLQKMNEPKIHFAINCASYSCPKLLKEAYTSQNVENLMNQAAKEFINSDKNIIKPNDVKLSRIFKWYKSDFLKESNSIIDYINIYSEIKINQNAIIDYKEYDWSLNEKK